MFGRLFGSMATGGLAGGIVWLLSHVIPHRRRRRVARIPVCAAYRGLALGLDKRRRLRRGIGGFGGGFWRRSWRRQWAAAASAAAASAAASVVAAVDSAAAAPRVAGDAVRPPHQARNGDALAHAHAIPCGNARCHRAGHQARGADARRRDSLRDRNRADAATHLATTSRRAPMPSKCSRICACGTPRPTTAS